MSQHEQDANDREAARYREGRINLIQKQLQQLYEVYSGKVWPQDAARSRADLEAEMQTLLDMRANATATDARTAAYHRAVMQLGQWVGDLRGRMDRIEQKLDERLRALEARFTSDDAARLDRQQELDATLAELRALIEAGAKRRNRQLNLLSALIIVVFVVDIVIRVLLR